MLFYSTQFTCYCHTGEHSFLPLSDHLWRNTDYSNARKIWQENDRWHVFCVVCLTVLSGTKLNWLLFEGQRSTMFWPENSIIWYSSNTITVSIGKIWHSYLHYEKTITFFIHVARMEEPEYVLLTGRLEGKKCKGRPREMMLRSLTSYNMT